MNRRKFIEKAGILSGMAMSSVSCLPGAEQPKFKMGYQLFSIRDEMAKAPVDTLKALKMMGYGDFEAYGFDDEKELLYGFEPSELKLILDDLDLTFTSAHFGFSSYLDKNEDDLKAFVDRSIARAKKLDLKYITWPWIAREQRTMDNFKLMSHYLNVIGEQVSAAGLGFAYHNHGFEFEDHDGENGFDVILKETDPSLVKLQMDMYWVVHSSKYTPKELIASQPGRYVMWHLKDMDRVTRDYTELGNGIINYLEILPDPTKSGLEYYYLEQGGNYTANSLKSAADSAEYFKAHLQKFL